MKLRYILVVWGCIVIFSICGFTFQWIDIKQQCCCHMDQDGHFVLPFDQLPLPDYTRLINLKDFQFLKLNEVCGRKFKKPWVLIMVHSAPNNFEKRDAIRNSWGKADKDFKILFLLGTTSQSIQRRLDRENQRYHDFIQGNFKDAYRNMTYKHIMLMKYVVYHCNKAKFVIKVDDDVFVNLGTIVDFFNSLPIELTTNLVMCKPNDEVKIIRHPAYKWYVTKKEYPHSEYPPYCAGFAIIYSTDAIYKLYVKAQEQPYFWIDDIFVTGFILPRTKLSIVNIKNAFDNEFDGEIPNSCDYFFSDSHFKVQHLLELDLQAKDGKIPCGVGALQQDIMVEIRR